MAAPAALRDFGVQVTAYEITDETFDGSQVSMTRITHIVFITRHTSIHKYIYINTIHT